MSAVWLRYEGTCSLYDTRGGQNGTQLVTGYAAVYYERCTTTSSIGSFRGAPNISFRGRSCQVDAIISLYYCNILVVRPGGVTPATLTAAPTSAFTTAPTSTSTTTFSTTAFSTSEQSVVMKLGCNLMA